MSLIESDFAAVNDGDEQGADACEDARAPCHASVIALAVLRVGSASVKAVLRLLRRDDLERLVEPGVAVPHEVRLRGHV